jgi:hypothetical protein
VILAAGADAPAVVFDPPGHGLCNRGEFDQDADRELGVFADYG